jgi:hypothetical protein
MIFLPVVLPIKNIMNTTKKDWLFIAKKLFLLVLPFILVLSVFYIFAFIFSFIYWHLPDNYYFPFLTGDEIQRVFDRVLLVIGILLMIFISDDE